MVAHRLEFKLEMSPSNGLGLLDITQAFWGKLRGYSKSLPKGSLPLFPHYGWVLFDQSLCDRFGHNRESLSRIVHSFEPLFPSGADYQHDQMERRAELSKEQRLVEPRNASSHLTFIGSGLMNCVTYQNQPSSSVYLVDLDDVYQKTNRRRQTTIIGFKNEETVLEISR